MNLNVAGHPYDSITDFVRHAPAQDQAFAESFADAGTSVLHNMMEAYSKGESRTRGEAESTVADLRDLKRAVRALIDRTNGDTETNFTELQGRLPRLTAEGQAEGWLKPASEETLSNAKRMAGYGCIASGRRTLGAESVTATRGPADKMTDLSKFLTDLNAVTALYATAVAVAGPISASVNSMPEEYASGSLRQRGSSQMSGSAQSAGYTMLGLGAHESSSQVSGSGSTATDGSFTHSRTTADIDIVGVAIDLQDRLEQIKVAPPTQAGLWAIRPYHEYTNVEVGRLWNKHTEERRPSSPDGSTSRAITERTAEYQPAHVVLPDTGIAAYVAG